MDALTQSKSQKILHLTSVVCLLGLIMLCTAWELVLAPLRPGGSWMAIKALPLMLPLAGVLRHNIYTLQWASMLVLLYFTEGVVRAWSEYGVSAALASTEIFLSTVFFFCAIFFIRPYKKMAKKIALEAIAKASTHEED